MQKIIWPELQLFAAEGESGAAAAGEGAADAGQHAPGRPEEQGVPREKNRSGAGRGAGSAPSAAGNAPEGARALRADSGGDAGGKSWEAVKAAYRADYDAEVQSIVQKRLRGAQEQLRQLTQREEKLGPVLDRLAARYGLAGGERDYDALLRRVSEDAALAPGAAEETENAPEENEAREEAPLRAGEGEAAARTRLLHERFDELSAQAAQFARKLPGFRLERELQSNRAFAVLTQPGSPVTVEQAYYATHPEFRQREAEAVAQRAAEALASSVLSGAARPRENGAQAATLGAIPYGKMPREDREALKRRIRDASARGEHLPYGG